MAFVWNDKFSSNHNRGSQLIWSRICLSPTEFSKLSATMSLRLIERSWGCQASAAITSSTTTSLQQWLPPFPTPKFSLSPLLGPQRSSFGGTHRYRAIPRVSVGLTGDLYSEFAGTGGVHVGRQDQPVGLVPTRGQSHPRSPNTERS